MLLPVGVKPGVAHLIWTKAEGVWWEGDVEVIGSKREKVTADWRNFQGD